MVSMPITTHSAHYMTAKTFINSPWERLPNDSTPTKGMHKKSPISHASANYPIQLLIHINFYDQLSYRQSGITTQNMKRFLTELCCSENRFKVAVCSQLHIYWRNPTYKERFLLRQVSCHAVSRYAGCTTLLVSRVWTPGLSIAKPYNITKIVRKNIIFQGRSISNIHSRTRFQSDKRKEWTKLVAHNAILVLVTVFHNLNSKRWNPAITSYPKSYDERILCPEQPRMIRLQCNSSHLGIHKNENKLNPTREKHAYMKRGGAEVGVAPWISSLTACAKRHECAKWSQTRKRMAMADRPSVQQKRTALSNVALFKRFRLLER